MAARTSLGGGSTHRGTCPATGSPSVATQPAQPSSLQPQCKQAHQPAARSASSAAPPPLTAAAAPERSAARRTRIRCQCRWPRGAAAVGGRQGQSRGGSAGSGLHATASGKEHRSQGIVPRTRVPSWRRQHARCQHNRQPCVPAGAAWRRGQTPRAAARATRRPMRAPGGWAAPTPPAVALPASPPPAPPLLRDPRRRRRRRLHPAARRPPPLLQRPPVPRCCRHCCCCCCCCCPRCRPWPPGGPALPRLLPSRSCQSAGCRERCLGPAHPPRHPPAAGRRRAPRPASR